MSFEQNLRGQDRSGNKATNGIPGRGHSLSDGMESFEVSPLRWLAWRISVKLGCSINEEERFPITTS